ncbi:hypothetical protein SAMN04487819_102358 [Actinopolyspora alba]|uniref:PE family protein n=1 Tax=Actinopolyspora alba TaxID=673379 RepID=A0A1I1UQJ7_9ACTN|nr:hypothetical protein [Actinopolyspora alba]SFD72974.1 hypothetical protein SAMN04487819_102358 [Actinopolyspora alba]
MSDEQNLTGNLSATNDAMQGIITAANNGQFVITPNAGDELIQIFQELEDYLGEKLYNIDYVKRDTPLGHSPAGESISAFNKQVASGDEESFEHLLSTMRQQAPKVVEAIRKGIDSYQESDNQSKQNLDNIE